MIYKEDDSNNWEDGGLNIVLQLSSPDQEGKSITITQNGAGLEVITRDSTGLLDKKILQHCG